MSEVVYILDIFFGADKLLLWRLIAFSSTVMLGIILMTLLYDDSLTRRSVFGVIVIVLILGVIGYAGWVITYFYNVPLGPPLKLVLYAVQKCTG